MQGAPDAYGQGLSPWPEFRLAPKEDLFAMAEAQTHRRFIKTHSPFNCVPYLPQVKYLFIGRDARDVTWSLYHHHSILTAGAYEGFNNTPGLVGPPLTPIDCDVRGYYERFLDQGHFPGFSPDTRFWPCIKSWWDVRELPNVMLLHFANLKQGFEAEARKVADFLDVEVADSLWPTIVKHCDIDYMREQSKQFDVLDQIFEGGGQNFINKGTNGRWRDILSQDEIGRCDRVAEAELGEECARWLRTGALQA